LISHGAIMLGAPNETFEQIKGSIKFSLKLDFSSYNILRPYPGTIYWNKKFRSKIHQLNGTLSLLHNNPSMVEWSQKIAALMFYFRFKTLKKLFSKNKYERYLVKEQYKKIYSVSLYNIRRLFKLQKFTNCW